MPGVGKGITRLGLAGISRPRYRFGQREIRIEALESGASTESEFVKRHLRDVGYYSDDRDWQRAYNRRERARRAAEAAAEQAETAKTDAKREAKRIYREIVRGPAPDAEIAEFLAETVRRFAPRDRSSDVLPPERAIKFDAMVRDVAALQAMYEAYYEQREQEMIAEENALLGVFLLAA